MHSSINLIIFSPYDILQIQYYTNCMNAKNKQNLSIIKKKRLNPKKSQKTSLNQLIILRRYIRVLMAQIIALGISGSPQTCHKKIQAAQAVYRQITFVVKISSSNNNQWTVANLKWKALISYLYFLSFLLNFIQLSVI